MISRIIRMLPPVVAVDLHGCKSRYKPVKGQLLNQFQMFHFASQVPAEHIFRKEYI